MLGRRQAPARRQDHDSDPACPRVGDGDGGVISKQIRRRPADTSLQTKVDEGGFGCIRRRDARAGGDRPVGEGRQGEFRARHGEGKLEQPFERFGRDLARGCRGEVCHGAITPRLPKNDPVARRDIMPAQGSGCCLTTRKWRLDLGYIGAASTPDQRVVRTRSPYAPQDERSMI